MADVPVKRRDINNLVRKLTRLELDLAPAERALLLFMLGVAADTINRSATGAHGSGLVTRAAGQHSPVVVRMSGPVPSIEDEFAEAFVAGAADRVQLLPGSVGPGQVD